jgi:hypothetical protein
LKFQEAKMIDYSLILVTNFLDKEWSLNGDSYDGLQWHDISPKPTQAELDALWESTQATIAAQEKAAKDAKASALAKLTALGLTADEVKALIG